MIVEVRAHETTSVVAQDTADEAAIRALVEDLSMAWARADASAIATRFQSDGTFTNINGTVFYGRQAFEERHRFLLEGPFKGSVAKLTVRRLRFMRPDVALVDVDCDLSGGAAPTIETRLLLVLGKERAEWSIAAFHNVDVKAVQVAPAREDDDVRSVLLRGRHIDFVASAEQAHAAAADAQRSAAGDVSQDLEAGATPAFRSVRNQAKAGLARNEVDRPETESSMDTATFCIPPGRSRQGEPMFLRGKDSFTWKVSSCDTAGGIAILEGTVSAGAGPVLHRHLHQNEWWYVLEGQFRFQVGDQIFRVEPGASVFGPQGVPHAFRCLGEAPGKMLFMFDPARQIEEFFAELVALGINAGAGRHSEKDLFARYGIEFVGPPLGPE